MVQNGTMEFHNQSVGNYQLSPLEGHGSIAIDEGSTVSVDQVSAGIFIGVNNGQLNLSNGMTFLGTVSEGPLGNIDITGAGTASKEIFHTASGMLDLENKSGKIVAAVKFVGASSLWTTPDGHGGMDVTTMPHLGSSLPVTFTH